jgi:SAM-dependent methyltransferase
MRLEAKIKGGYYPTPPEVVELIISHISRKDDGLVRIYDPCCGYGEAIRTIADCLGAESYGVELEQERAAEAKKVLTRCLQGDAFKIKATREGFSLLLLNPPYDFDEDERTEHRFLAATHQFLMPEGLLIYIIPQHRLYKKTARLLASWFTDIEAYCFPSPHRELFNQIVLFAVKNPAASFDEERYAYLSAIVQQTLPPLVMRDTPAYAIPAAPGDKTFYLKNLDPSPDELAEEAKVCGSWKDFWARIAPPAQARTVKPVMPLRKGHIAILVATGMANGVLEKNGKRFLMKGSVRKEQVVTKEPVEDGIIETTRDIITIVVKALDLNTGEIITIQ